MSGTLSPISLHPANPHYLLFRGKPTVLVSSAEHYGAVLNADFNYRTYLRTLGKNGLNQTRVFTGMYREIPGSFGIRDNTLAPRSGRLLCPWARSSRPGYAYGGNRFDLTRWDTRYFDRLKDFMRVASGNGVVVELVLFCRMYNDPLWEASPLHAACNVNNVGDMPRSQVFLMKNRRLQTVMDRMVRKLVHELNPFDNLYYEIANEPYITRDTPDRWQRHVAKVIRTTERALPNRHLIARNDCNTGRRVRSLDPNVDIVNFHYSLPELAVAPNLRLNRVLADDETGFADSKAEPYRVEAWQFLLAGGAIYSNLDYTFALGHEDGAARNKAPGCSVRSFKKQLPVLRWFLESFDFVRMTPDMSFVVSCSSKRAKVQALANPAEEYALHIAGGERITVGVRLPKGEYQAEWISTTTGRTLKRTAMEGGRTVRLTSPAYTADIALALRNGVRATL